IVGTADDVVGHAVEVLDIAEVKALLSAGASHPFTEAELAYARDKSDPDRRLAARLAAKRAAARRRRPARRDRGPPWRRRAATPEADGQGARAVGDPRGGPRAREPHPRTRAGGGVRAAPARGDMSLGRSLLRLGLLIVVAALLAAAYLSLA